MSDLRIGFIGAGKMATALASGFIGAGLVERSRVFAADPVKQAAAAFAKATGGQVLLSNQQVAEESALLFLAVKPQQMHPVLADLKAHVAARHLVVSVAAGVPLAALAEGLGEGPRLVRVMPNTPCLVGQGASGYCGGRGATAADLELVGRLLESVGRAWLLEERLLDAVTGLSGSGPAFVFVMIEALSDGGVRMGLPRATALALAAQTVLGAARMVLETGEHPAALKDQVASPGGTTIAGLAALESGGVRAALIAAVQAATARSLELGKS